jgi:cytochrome P450
MTTIVKLFNFLLLPFAHWLQKLPLPHSNRFRQAKNTLDSVIYRMINERRTSGQDTGDLLSMLLAARDEDDGTPMTNEQIRDEALTLFLAGHETTANALTWTWMLLSQNPEKEAKLHEELDSVFAGRLPDISDLANLRYTESVIAESMRLFPPAWAIGRLATDEHAFGYFKVPTGSLLLISPYVTQRDPRFWADADKFIPERWAEQSIKEAGQKNIFLPFGGGIRRCIGESFAWTEAILVVATLARRWRLRVVPEQRFDLQPMITLRPKYGMKMSLNCRQAGETLT